MTRFDKLSSQVLTYFSRGRLPWQGLKASNKKQRYEKICEVKMSTSVASLCHGLMPELRLYLDYVRKLSFSERPDYALLRGMFLEVLEAKGLSVSRKNMAISPKNTWVGFKFAFRFSRTTGTLTGWL